MMTNENFTILGIVCLIAFVVAALYKQDSDTENFIEKCKTTDFYIVGNKGHIAKVYDCKGVVYED